MSLTLRLTGRQDYARRGRPKRLVAALHRHLSRADEVIEHAESRAVASYSRAITFAPIADGEPGADFRPGG
jgi:hypothetical protein